MLILSWLQAMKFPLKLQVANIINFISKRHLSDLSADNSNWYTEFHHDCRFSPLPSLRFHDLWIMKLCNICQCVCFLQYHCHIYYYYLFYYYYQYYYYYYYYYYRNILKTNVFYLIVYNKKLLCAIFTNVPKCVFKNQNKIS